jgi:hypothetical protein
LIRSTLSEVYTRLTLSEVWKRLTLTLLPTPLVHTLAVSHSTSNSCDHKHHQRHHHPVRQPLISWEGVCRPRPATCTKEEDAVRPAPWCVLAHFVVSNLNLNSNIKQNHLESALPYRSLHIPYLGPGDANPGGSLVLFLAATGDQGVWMWVWMWVWLWLNNAAKHRSAAAAS